MSSSLASPALDVSPSPVPGMPMGIYQARRRGLRGMAIFMTLLIVLMAAVSWLVWPPGIQSLSTKQTQQRRRGSR